MDDREVTVTRWDVQRLLSPKEFTELENIRRVIDQGHRLAPWAERLYDNLLEKVRRMKLKEHAEMLVEEYAGKLKEDDFSLEEFSDGWAVSSRREAAEFLAKKFPEFEKILLESDPADWLPRCVPKIRDAAEPCVRGVFEGLMSQVGHPEAFGFDMEIWPFIVPHVNYAKAGVDSLEFCLRPYAVYAIKVRRAEHEKNFRGWVSTFPSSETPLCLFTEILDSFTLNVALPKITLPLKLLRGLASGDLQPGSCEVIRQEGGVLTYAVEGFNGEVILPHAFMTFVMGLGEDPLKALQELGLLDEITLRILEAKRDVKPIEPPMVREKDRGYLRKIHEVEGFLTYKGWGEILELTRDGAYRSLTRLEENGLVNTEKHESGEGTRASLTALGMSAIR